MNKSHYPITIIYPAGTPLAVPAGQWRKLDTGEIVVTYNEFWELYWSVTISMWHKTTPPATDQGQLMMFETATNNYYRE